MADVERMAVSAGQALRRRTDAKPQRAVFPRSVQYGDTVVSKGWGTLDRQVDVAYKAWCIRRGINPLAL